ncbi:MAG: hypothetical protein MUC59_19120, partial [Saprospiraceae bacterium]|nr:hypothetical protein [Saprospiraceae bacterium]
MNRLFTTAFFTAFTCLVFGQNLQPDFSKIDQSLVEKTAGGKAVPFLVLLPQQADLSSARQLKTKDAKAAFVFNKLRETAHVTQAGLSAFLFQKNAKHEGIFIVNAIKVEGDFALVAELSQRPDVAQIMDNPTMRNAEPVENYEEVVTERVLVEWGIDMINANDVWALGYRGEGVTIGGQDTGYDWTHPALKSKYRGYDATTGIADHNLQLRTAFFEVGQVGEVFLRHPRHVRIDVVKAVGVPAASIAGGRACSHAHDAHAHAVRTALQAVERLPDARRVAVVARWIGAELRR